MRSVWAVTGLAIPLLIGLATHSDAVPVAQREFDWVLERTPDVKRGEKIYDTCAACHGKYGEGVSDGTVPAIGGQHFTVLAKQLVDFRTGFRADPRMKHFADVRFLAISQDIADVAAYISQLPVPERKVPTPNGTSVRGATLYAKSCARCHGEAGQGNADQLAPRLAAQHGDYLIRQLEDTQAGWRETMKDAHLAPLQGLSKTEVAEIAGYLSALEAPAPRPTG
ncbi:MAG TPA: c-type cytochrome [Steroidobacteraceae bacterium]